MAMSPIWNFLPSRAMVAKMFGPFSSTSFPRTRGASSRMMEMTGFVCRLPVDLWYWYRRNASDAIRLPISISCAPANLRHYRRHP